MTICPGVYIETISVMDLNGREKEMSQKKIGKPYNKRRNHNMVIDMPHNCEFFFLQFVKIALFLKGFDSKATFGMSYPCET